MLPFFPLQPPLPRYTFQILEHPTGIVCVTVSTQYISIGEAVKRACEIIDNDLKEHKTHKDTTTYLIRIKRA